MTSEQRLIWVDMEMTGLDPDTDVVIEIASIVTTTDLEVLAEGPVIAIHQSDATLAKMDEWNTRTHGESGLVDRVRASSTDEAAATELTLEFFKEWVEPNTSPMCGNSIGQDRRFMARHMPELEAFFHYRNLDVTTLKLLAGYWRADLPAHPKQNAHEALADIRESIEELRYYREHLIRSA
ncbi:oligoribonuclease (3'-_5' exoribonuclease) [gamma proteobacterium HIMB55]|nr:oligoribonuclease (3'->5' exoribonuclease) [gamma proteobacterium HIMB55]